MLESTRLKIVSWVIWGVSAIVMIAISVLNLYVIRNGMVKVTHGEFYIFGLYTITAVIGAYALFILGKATYELSKVALMREKYKS